MLKTNYKDNILSFYNNFIKYSSPDSPNSVAWTTKESQFKRFDIINKIGITNEDTILDLGCGMGHYTEYLNYLEYPLKKYTGIDINELYIKSCNDRLPGLRFLCGEIYDLNERFDYVVGSGVFTVAMSNNEILDAIAYAYKISNKGVCFNFLTKDYINHFGFNSFEPNIFYNELSLVYDNIKIITDYINNEDFTIYIYK